MKSIKQYGKIIQDAFSNAIDKMIYDHDFCVSLDGEDYTEEDFQRFIRELDDFTDCIDGMVENKDELDRITFMGAFPLAFTEGQEFEDVIEEIDQSIQDEYEYEYE